MTTTVNKKGLRQSVWDFLIVPGHERPMIVWCQWGTFAADEVRDVVQTYARTSDKVRVTINDDESINIGSFISDSIMKKKENERLICVSVMPFENTDTFLASFEEDFQSIRYQVDPNEWLSDHQNEIQKPIEKFIRKYPQFLMMQYGKRPSPNTVGPCPAIWLDISRMWAETNVGFIASGFKLPGKTMVRQMMVDVASSMGVCEPLFSKLKWFLLLNRGYKELHLPVRKFYDLCDAEAHFKNIFNE